jgi:hypothetical protein
MMKRADTHTMTREISSSECAGGSELFRSKLTDVRASCFGSGCTEGSNEILEDAPVRDGRVEAKRYRCADIRI